ncbi:MULTISPECIES: helix-turn-helix domain-containing protein [Metallosphaera]|uniref:Bacterio-opsin activator n=1 Tax=Metallosphaera cuprina (strain Ar-4) TaxID=1006006 RepID=F4G066_METCR|nr:helix-turn-helix domain-containing protein [Metallosphaera cuprina]AEB94565.1 bacterio-opsin activator [Metallosphaera cuprina Ar-4]
MGTLKVMTISIQHENCWTSELEDLEAITMNYHVYPDKGYLRSRIVINAGDRSVVGKMRNSQGVVKVNKVTTYNDVNFVDFLNRYRGSIAGLLYDMEVMFLFNKIRRGVETWSFVISRDRTSEVLRSLSSQGKLLDYTIDDYKLQLGPNLSQAEKRALRTALANGYLDYPRRADADVVASELGLSKVTFLHHLRNAYRKLATHYLTKSQYLE